MKNIQIKTITPIHLDQDNLLKKVTNLDRIVSDFVFKVKLLKLEQHVRQQAIKDAAEIMSIVDKSVK